MDPAGSKPKYDVKKAERELYAPGRTFTLVEVPTQQFLAVDGHGNPNTSPEYAAALEALYSVGYTLKFSVRRRTGQDAVVGPLEGLWRADNPEVFVQGNKDSWDWTMLISQPEWISQEMAAEAAAEVRVKKGLDTGKIRWLELEEGLSVQVLHVGSYDDEAPVLARLHHEFMPSNQLDFNGDHHEIYLSDPRRTAPEKLKTILRQPVRRK
ncbi:GyrI-like domain-containing protein [Arthrobacter sp. zg-Y916]|uniref:GyrI-like domain-containing protein n=1 Tax=Arthrobacter caoxuetaonis TaxID=2886935 RepID=A0A9X1SET3_9MICC|nr:MULTISPECIES: GyrI-like domain-containing protein [Arthrobacter]MCC3298004.1 GyrI-like domain-containing protein [Arthrobacter caoxuetaonis]MCC9192196.1 GyrI-like domain-containing protein [Arthrobacter sp. zg-Y916]USQ57018.1 GyrI-like domain-containing protein [Arthrobacter caoxuetaonis]